MDILNHQPRVWTLGWVQCRSPLAPPRNWSSLESLPELNEGLLIGLNIHGIDLLWYLLCPSTTVLILSAPGLGWPGPQPRRCTFSCIVCTHGSSMDGTILGSARIAPFIGPCPIPRYVVPQSPSGHRPSFSRCQHACACMHYCAP
jgi:hypothetical protein